MKLLIALGSLLLLSMTAQAQVEPEEAILYADFAEGSRNAGSQGQFILQNGLQRDEQGRLEFTTARQLAELDQERTGAMSRALRNVDSLTVGGWFLLRRRGEQVLIGRDEVVIGALGERFFRPNERFINFALGTDERGFLMGTINGSGRMPFLHVTVNSVPILQWQQLGVTKDSGGHHRFYQNGVLIHSDHRALSAPSRQPWNETEQGRTEPIRLRMPTGGLIGEVWVLGRALSAEEIAADYKHKKGRYLPAPPARAVAVREMFSRPAAEPLAYDRARVEEAMRKLLGPFPDEQVPLEPQVHSEEDCGTYIRRKVSIQVQPGDRMPAYLLIPKTRSGPVPAIICFYGTTGGTGKRTTVGLSGLRPDEPPHPNLSFAVDVAEAGFIAFAPDYLRDGERVHPGDAPYDTTRFYEQLPEWSVHGKDIWDTMRAIDYLQSLPDVDGARIGMIGHSYGGHSTIFAAALEPRIKAAVANGPVSAFREHGMHWAVPKGARNSQSLPALRPYLLNPKRPLPVTFAELTALIAPRPLLVGQAAGERRPIEEENYGFVRRVYQSAGAGEKVDPAEADLVRGDVGVSAGGSVAISCAVDPPLGLQAPGLQTSPCRTPAAAVPRTAIRRLPAAPLGEGSERWLTENVSRKPVGVSARCTLCVRQQIDLAVGLLERLHHFAAVEPFPPSCDLGNGRLCRVPQRDLGAGRWSQSACFQIDELPLMPRTCHCSLALVKAPDQTPAEDACNRMVERPLAPDGKRPPPLVYPGAFKSSGERLQRGPQLLGRQLEFADLTGVRGSDLGRD